MAALIKILTAALIVGYILVGIYWWACWLGMHKNYAAIDTLSLLWPSSRRDDERFTSRGNMWRRKFTRANMFLLVLTVCLIFFVVFV